MAVVVVIPARLASTRLPRKMLAELNGRPMLWHVWNRARQARGVSAVYVAADSAELCDAVKSWGGHALITSPECRSGTERAASVLPRLDADLIVNVQGDEPLLDPRMIEELGARWSQSPSDLITPVFQIRDPARLHDPAVVKVVRTAHGRALYFSRSPIPYFRDVPAEQWLRRHCFWGHVGVYGYSRMALSKYAQLPPSPLEDVERLEQLRFLEAGLAIQTFETSYESVSVDTPADLENVRRRMAAGGSRLAASGS